jgi:hypothetical protein
MHAGFWRETWKENGQYENIDVDGRAVLKWILEK